MKWATSHWQETREPTRASCATTTTTTYVTMMMLQYYTLGQQRGQGKSKKKLCFFTSLVANHMGEENFCVTKKKWQAMLCVCVTIAPLQFIYKLCNNWQLFVPENLTGSSTLLTTPCSAYINRCLWKPDLTINTLSGPYYCE